MDKQLFDDLHSTLKTEGPDQAIDKLCKNLREQKDYENLFYALLLKKRQELGVSPIPTSSAMELPKEVHAEYEDAIRVAARTVGNLFLKEKDIRRAFDFLNMIGEIDPVNKAIEEYSPDEEEDIEPIVGLAFYQGLNPEKGFDLILSHYGICSAITTIGSGEMPIPPDSRDYCIKQVIRALYQELQERLIAEIQREEGKAPPPDTPVKELIQGRFYLFGEDYFHVDISHLGAVVQYSTVLKPCEELSLARELCEYGNRLSDKVKYGSEPPFENQYEDYGIYLATLAGENVEEGITHFLNRLESYNPDEIGTYPAEIIVNLLVQTGHLDKALEVAGKYLTSVPEGNLSCPGVVELCEKTKNFETLAELAKKHDNLVHYLAGLIAAQNSDD